MRAIYSLVLMARWSLWERALRRDLHTTLSAPIPEYSFMIRIRTIQLPPRPVYLSFPETNILDDWPLWPRHSLTRTLLLDAPGSRAFAHSWIQAHPFSV